MRILVVEDDEHLQRVLSRVLRHHIIVLVSSAEDAITVLKEGPAIDAVLSDYELAGEYTGGYLLGWIRTNRPELVEKFVFSSGNEVTKKIHHRNVPKPALAEDIKREFEGD